MTESDVAETMIALASRLDAPLTGSQVYQRFTRRMTRRRVWRRRAVASAVLAGVASVATVLGGVWGEPTRYASAGLPAADRSIAAEGTYQGRPWTVSVAIARHCDDPSLDMVGYGAPPGPPTGQPKPPPFRINVRSSYDGTRIGDLCDQYPFLAATWPGFGPLINYGGGEADLPHTKIGVFTGWTQPNVAWVRVSFGNGQKLTLKTISVGHGITLRFFGYVADNRLSVSHLSGYDDTGHYLGHIGGKN